MTDTSGTLLGLNKYDEYGNPQSTNLGVFGYTGQAWLPTMGVWYYKARIYEPELGRFLQTDPIGMEGGINLYAYVENDPVNESDPLGLASSVKPVMTPCGRTDGTCWEEIVVTGQRALKMPSWLTRSAALLTSTISSVSTRFSGSRNGTAKATAPPREKKPCTPTTEQKDLSGQVTYKLTEGSLSAGGTVGHLEGSFRTTEGYTGNFETWVYGLSASTPGTFVGIGTGVSRNLSTFSGANVNVGLSVVAVTFGLNYDPVTLGRVGGTNVAHTPSLGVSLTRSNTKLKDVRCPAG